MRTYIPTIHSRNHTIRIHFEAESPSVPKRPIRKPCPHPPLSGTVRPKQQKFDFVLMNLYDPALEPPHASEPGTLQGREGGQTPVPDGTAG